MSRITLVAQYERQARCALLSARANTPRQLFWRVTGDGAFLFPSISSDIPKTCLKVDWGVEEYYKRAASVARVCVYVIVYACARACMSVSVGLSLASLHPLEVRSVCRS